MLLENQKAAVSRIEKDYYCKMNKTDIVIIGGGVACYVAAVRLSQHTGVILYWLEKMR